MVEFIVWTILIFKFEFIICFIIDVFFNFFIFVKGFLNIRVFMSLV